MASIRKHGDKWRAEIWRDGKRASKVHRTKREAQEWASREEFNVDVAGGKALDRMTLADAVDRYEKEIIPNRKLKWNTRGSEMYVLKLIREDVNLASKMISDITPQELSSWRDRHMGRISPASAQRYMNTLSAIFTAAVKDWSALTENPMKKVRRPEPAKKRNRRPSADEIESLSVAGGDIKMAMGRAHQAFIFAIETGMRASEIAMLEWQHIDLDRRAVHVPRTKNGQPRDVPLSLEAIRILRQFEKQDPPFGFRGGTHLSSSWFFLKGRAGVDGLSFHDSRHEAVTRLSKKLDVLALARMIGHKNINELMTYYNETAEELASRLD